jgi:ABC-type arginine/histidine transport system permease subunit
MADPAEEAAIRRQVEATLRVMKISMVVGVVVLVILAIAVSSLRGVFLLAAIIYLFGSLGTQWYLRRKFLGQLLNKS